MQVVVGLLAELRGETVTRVFLDQWSAGFLTGGDAMLRLEGSWKLFDQEAAVIDSSTGLENRSTFNLWRLCGSKLLDVKLTGDDETTLRVLFDNGCALEAYFGAEYTDWDLKTPKFSLFCEGIVHFADFTAR